MEVYPPEDPTPGEVVGGPSVSQLEQMKAWDASFTQLERVIQEACETEVCPNTSDWSKQSTSASPSFCESDAVNTVHNVKRKYEEIEFDDLENLRPKLKRTNQLLDLDTKKIMCPESSTCDISDTTSDPVSQLVHEEEEKFVPPSENYLNDLGDHKDTSTLSFSLKEDKPYVNDVEDKTLLDVDKKILVHETESKPLVNQTPSFVFEDKKDVLDFMDSKKCTDFIDSKESITYVDCKNSTGVEDSKNISLMDCKNESVKDEVCDEVKPTIVNTKDEPDFKELEVGDVAKAEPIVNSEVSAPTECKAETTCTDNTNSSSPDDATGDSKSKEKKKKKDEESPELCKNVKKDEKTKRKKFERCNIRHLTYDDCSLDCRYPFSDIRLEENLDAVTLAAQKEEKDRIQRIQEAQMRALQERLKQIEDEKEVLTQLFSQPPPEASHLFESSSEENADLTSDSSSKPELPLIRSENDVVLLESSDEEKKTKLQELIPPPQTAVENVIDISSSDSDDIGEDDDLDKKDDDIMVLSDEGDTEGGDGEDPNNSGAHTNDCFNMPDMEGRVLVNVGHPPEDPDIFLAPQIAKVIKPHQIGGIRFLYDNVVENLERYKSSSGFGCILAHSMGLGKTVQVVSFVDVFLRHTPATLVLCIVPINTIQNWKAEFDMWVPPVNIVDESQVESGEIRPRDYNVYTLNENFKTMAARAALIAEWRRHGGVLLMGYEMYRMLALRKMPKIPVKKTKRQKKLEALIEPETNDQIKKYMDQMYEHIVIPGPDLVICDEGHRIKNSLASTSMALKSIKTRRRVVLTGYPLQNNLLEYWCMVDFVRPNYLGSRAEFCNMFERPISNGQCIDSTPRDRQLMRFRSHVLHSLLVGFVQRRGHSVLRAVLPKKEEHVLLIRMTPIQRKLYKCFVKDLLYVQKATNPLKLFAVCCKIWNHPDILYKLLQEKKMQEDIDLDIDLATLTPGSTIPGTNCVSKKKTPAKQMAKVIDRMQPVKLQPKPMKPLALPAPQSQTQGQQLHGMCIESQQFSDQSDSQSSNQMNEQLQYSQSTNQVVCKQEYSTTQSPHPSQQGQFSQQQQNSEFSQCVQQGFAQSSQTSFQHSQYSPQSASPQQFCQQKFPPSSSQQHYSGTTQKNQSQFLQQQFSPQNNSQQTSQSQYPQQPMLQQQYSQQSQTQFSQQANSQQSQFSSSPTAPQQQFSQQSTAQSQQQSPAQSQQQFSHPSSVQHQPQFSQSSAIPQQQLPSQTQHFSQPSPQQFSMQSPVHTEQQFHPQSPHSQHFSQQSSAQPHQQFQSQSSANQQFQQPTSSPQFCQQTSQQQQKPFTQQTSSQQQQFSQQSPQQFPQQPASQQQFPQAAQQQYAQQSSLQQPQQYVQQANVQQQYPQQSTTPQQQQQQQYSQQSSSQQQYPQQTNSQQQQQQYSQQATQPPQQYSQQTSGTQQYPQQSSNQDQQQYHQQSSSQQHYPQQSNTQQYSLQPSTQQYSQQANAQQQQFPRQSPPQSQFPQQGHVAQQNFPQASPQSQFPQPSPPLQSQQFSQPSPQPQSSPQQFPRQSSPQQLFPQPSPPIQQYSQQSPPQQQQFSQQSPPQPLSSPHQQYSKSSPPHQGYPQQFSQQSSSPYPQPSPPHQQFQQPSHKYPQDTSPQQQYPQYPQQPSPQQQFNQSSSQQSYSHQSSQQYVHSGQQYPQQHSPQHFSQQVLQNQFSSSPQQQYSHQTVSQQQQYTQQSTSQSSFPHQQAQTSNQSQSHFSQPSPQPSSQQFSKPSSQTQPFNQPPVSASQPQYSQHQPVQSSTKQFNQQQQSPSTASQQQFGQQPVPAQQSFNPQQSVSPQHQYNHPQVGSTQQQFSQPHQVTSSQQTFNQQGQVLSSQQQYSTQPQPASTVAQSYTPKASQPVSSQSFVQQQYSQQTHSSQSQQYTQQQCHQSASAQQYQQQNFTQQSTQLYQQQLPQTQQTSSVQITPIPQSPEAKQPPAVGRGRGKQARTKQSCQSMQQSYVQQTSDMKHSAQYTMQNFHQQNSSAQTMVQQQTMQQTNKQIQKRAGQHHFQPIVKQEGVTLQPVKQEPNTLPAKCQKAILHTTAKPQTLCQQTMLPSRQQMVHQMPMKNHLDGSQMDGEQHCTAPVHDVAVSSYQNRMDSSISYEWAIPIMKDYVLGVLENSHKMMVLFVIIEQTILVGDKILVFSQSLSTLDLLEHFLAKTAVPRRPDLPEDTPVENWCRNKNYFRLDGSTSAQEREKLINEFNKNENVSLFLLSTRAGCLGINLVGANRIVVMDASWNPCHDAQAVCRIYRYGQKKPCHIYRLVTDNSLEKKIYDRQVNKQGMSDRVVDELNPESNFTWKDVTTLIQDNEDDGPVQELTSFASNYTDEVLKYLVTNMSANLSKEPFEHESLLLDRKDLKLTKQEKRLAKQSYEMAKRANMINIRTTYTYLPAGAAGTGGQFVINNKQCQWVGGTTIRVLPSQSTPIPMQPSGVTATIRTGTTATPITASPSLMNTLFKQGVMVQKLTMPSNVSIPVLTPGSPPVVIPAGQDVLVLRTPKGVYLRLPDGRIIAVQLPPSLLAKTQFRPNVVTHFRPQQKAGNKQTATGINTPRGQSIGIIKQTLQCGGTVRFVGPRNAAGNNAQNANRSSAPEVIDLSDDDEPSAKKNSSTSVHPTSCVDGESGNFEQHQETSQDPASKPSPVQVQQKQITIRRISPTSQPSTVQLSSVQDKKCELPKVLQQSQQITIMPINTTSQQNKGSVTKNVLQSSSPIQIQQMVLPAPKRKVPPKNTSKIQLPSPLLSAKHLQQNQITISPTPSFQPHLQNPKSRQTSPFPQTNLPQLTIKPIESVPSTNSSVQSQQILSNVKNSVLSMSSPTTQADNAQLLHNSQSITVQSSTSQPQQKPQQVQNLQRSAMKPSLSQQVQVDAVQQPNFSNPTAQLHTNQSQQQQLPQTSQTQVNTQSMHQPSVQTSAVPRQKSHVPQQQSLLPPAMQAKVQVQSQLPSSNSSADPKQQPHALQSFMQQQQQQLAQGSTAHQAQSLGTSVPPVTQPVQSQAKKRKQPANRSSSKKSQPPAQLSVQSNMRQSQTSDMSRQFPHTQLPDHSLVDAHFTSFSHHITNSDYQTFPSFSAPKPVTQLQHPQPLHPLQHNQEHSVPPHLQHMAHIYPLQHVPPSQQPVSDLQSQAPRAWPVPQPPVSSFHPFGQSSLYYSSGHSHDNSQFSLQPSFPPSQTSTTASVSQSESSSNTSSLDPSSSICSSEL